MSTRSLSNLPPLPPDPPWHLVAKFLPLGFPHLACETSGCFEVSPQNVNSPSSASFPRTKQDQLRKKQKLDDGCPESRLKYDVNFTFYFYFYSSFSTSYSYVSSSSCSSSLSSSSSSSSHSYPSSSDSSSSASYSDYIF